jgi:integrase
MTIRNREGRIVFCFNCKLPDGSTARCREQSDKRWDDPRVKSWAEAKDKAIVYAKDKGSFDYLEFFPYGSKAHLFREGRGDISLNEFYPKWMEYKTKQDIRRNTAKGWQIAYDKHIGPYMGHLLLTQISEDQIFDLRFHLTNLRDKDDNRMLANSTINDNIIKTLCMCLKNAHKRGLINAYPCEGVGRLAEIPPEIYPLSFDELRTFLDFLRVSYPNEHDMYFIWSRQGFRPGEICALKWDKIDYYNMKTLVRETLHDNKSSGPPKTPSSVRDVDIATNEVKAAYKRQEARTGLMNSYVFMTGNNKPYTSAYIRNRFKHLMRRAGLRIRAPKQMRHTFATLNIGAGENITWVSKMLGHSDVVVTLKKYNRFVPNLTGRDGSAFEKVFNSVDSDWSPSDRTEVITGKTKSLSGHKEIKK